jgi:hypothetical protein
LHSCSHPRYPGVEFSFAALFTPHDYPGSGFCRALFIPVPLPVRWRSPPLCGSPDLHDFQLLFFTRYAIPFADSVRGRATVAGSSCCVLFTPVLCWPLGAAGLLAFDAPLSSLFSAGAALLYPAAVCAGCCFRPHAVEFFWLLLPFLCRTSAESGCTGRHVVLFGCHSSLSGPTVPSLGIKGLLLTSPSVACLDCAC